MTDEAISTAILTDLETRWKEYFDGCGVTKKYWEESDTGEPRLLNGARTKRHHRDLRATVVFNDGKWIYERNGQKNRVTQLIQHEIITKSSACRQVYSAWKESKSHEKVRFTAKFKQTRTGLSSVDVKWIISTIIELENASHAKSYIPLLISSSSSEELGASFNCTSQRLFNSKAVQDLRVRYAHELQISSTTHFNQFACQALHIIETSQIAKTSVDPTEADVFLLDGVSLLNHLDNEVFDRCIIFRDQSWWEKRPPFSMDKMWDEFATRQAIEPTFEVEAQDLGIDISKRSLVSMTLDEVKERWRLRGPEDYPLNLLDLRITQDNVTPWPFAQNCTILQEAVDMSVANMVKSTVGKITRQPYRDTDLESSTFGICGQAGAFSAFHMDYRGPITWTSLEKSTTDGSGTPPIKLWAVICTHNLTPQDKERVWTEFKLQGSRYKPSPDLVRIICLTEGDTLIMPPGTIHAPITVTDCYFRGGMVYHIRHIPQSLKTWQFLVANPHCTNENPSRQSRQVVPYIVKLFLYQVKKADDQAPLLTPRELDTLHYNAHYITHAPWQCRCSTETPCSRGNCGCLKADVACGDFCKCKGACGNKHEVYQFLSERFGSGTLKCK